MGGSTPRGSPCAATRFFCFLPEPFIILASGKKRGIDKALIELFTKWTLLISISRLRFEIRRFLPGQSSQEG